MILRPWPLTLAVTLAYGCGPANGDRERPIAGIAVRDSVGGWCAELARDSVATPIEGEPATLVFAGDSSHLSARAWIRSRRAAPCPTAFPQPWWTSYDAFDLELADQESRRDSLPYLALVVTGDRRVNRDSRGVIRGDLDGDGVDDAVRRCAADEGEHITVWKLSRGGVPVLWWHEYFDWGVIVDPTCSPGEDGRDIPKHQPRGGARQFAP